MTTKNKKLMNNYAGSYWVLNALPIWATAIILYMVTIGVIFILRDRCEGLFYNTSYSAVLGDGALLVVVLMAAGILQREVSLPEWLQNGSFHFVATLCSITLGLAWWHIGRPKQWGDIYHHLVIAPLLCYLLLTLLPVIFGNGTKVEVITTISLIVLWWALAVYDFSTERLNQREYFGLGEHLGTIWLKRWQAHG